MPNLFLTFSLMTCRVAMVATVRRAKIREGEKSSLKGPQSWPSLSPRTLCRLQAEVTTKLRRSQRLPHRVKIDRFRLLRQLEGARVNRVAEGRRE